MQSFLRRLRRGGRRGDRASRNRLRSGLSRLRHLQTFSRGRSNLGGRIYRRNQRTAKAVPRQNRADEKMAKEKRQQPTRPDAKETLA